MTSIEAAKKLYDLFSLLSDFILQRKQKEVIAQREF